MENTTGDVMSPPPLPDDPVRGAIGVLSPTSPTTDTEHTTGDCTNKTNFSIFCMNNKLFFFHIENNYFYNKCLLQISNNTNIYIDRLIKNIFAPTRIFINKTMEI